MKLNSTYAILLTLLTFSFSSSAQVLNQAAAWPNAAWTISGTYTASGLIDNPTIASNFLFDDDEAGNGSIDEISAASATIDLIAAHTAGETWLNVNTSYVYREIVGVLSLEYWNADASMWVNWEDFTDNSTNTDYQTCASTVAFTSSTLDISAFTATQLSGFQYRFHYDDNADWNWGFCIQSPTISSSSPPSCLDPTNLGATNITSSSADLIWTGSGTTYSLQFGLSGFPLTGSGTTGVTSPYSVTGLMSATAYDFYVQSICGPDSSNWAGPFTFNTTPDYCGADNFYDTGGAGGTYSSNETTITTICPDNIGDFVTVTFNSFSVEATWDALYVYDGPDTSSTLISSGNPITQSNFPAGGYYGTTPPGPFYSSDTSGCLTFLFLSDGSVTEDGWDATVTCSGSATCAAPTNLLATNITSNSADLNWTGSGTVVTYYILLDTAGFVPTGSGTAVAASPYSATGLTSGTAYDFYVLADCGFGVSTWTGPFTFTTLVPCPVIVQLPADTTICTDQSLTLDGGAGAYTYLWSTGETTQTIVVDSASFGGAGTYNISVTVSDSVNNCSVSDSIVVTISTCVGIDNQSQNIDIQLYPNPNSGLFYLELDLAERSNLEVQIVNSQGQMVYSSKAYKNRLHIKNEIDLRQEAKGMYFIHVISNKGLISKKILIQ